MKKTFFNDKASTKKFFFNLCFKGHHQDSKKKKERKKVERQPIECKTLFANYTSDKKLVFRIYKELVNSIIKKTSKPIITVQRICIDISPKKIYKWLITT